MKATRMKAQPQNATALSLIVKARWPNGVRCPLCESKEVTPVQSRGIFQCNLCRKQFSVFKNTRLERMRLTPVQFGNAVAGFLGERGEISVRGLQKRLETTSVSSAQRLLKKLKAVQQSGPITIEEFIRRILYP